MIRTTSTRPPACSGCGKYSKEDILLVSQKYHQTSDYNLKLCVNRMANVKVAVRVRPLNKR